MKTKLQKAMCALFAMAVCVSVNATVYTGNCGDSEMGQDPTNAVTWSFNDVNGVMTISGTGAVKTFSDQSPMEYPWNSTEEGSDAATFNPMGDEGWTGIHSLVIEEGVTNIPDYAFAMQQNLQYVTLPSTLKEIGNSALEECAFTKLTLPDGLLTIGDYALVGNKFSTLLLPKTLTSIGESAFNDCSSLKSIVIPHNVAEIGAWAFYGCTSLTSVTVLGDNPPTLGENAFMSDYEAQTVLPALTAIKVLESSEAKYEAAVNWNTYVTLIEPVALTTVTYTATQQLPRFEEIQYFVGAEYVYSHTFMIPVNEEIGDGEVVYVGAVTEFANNCLQWTSALRSIVVPDGVKKLGYQSFYACQNMTDISLPTTLEEIGDVSGLAFDGCSSLEKGKFIIKDMKWWCDLVIKGLYSNPVYYAKHIYDAEGQEITDLVIPEDVTSVGDNAFYRCEGLKSVTFHDNMTYIGSNAFNSCTGLTSVTIPEGVTEIQEGTFANCSNLTSVNIHEGVTKIGNAAFSKSGLTSLTLPSTITSMMQSFYGCEQLETLTLTDGISDINGSFYSCNALKEVRIPGSIKTMMYQDFQGCASLETVIIDEGVEEVAGFSECTSLRNLTLASSVKKLDGLGFRGCTSLEIVNLPEGMEYIASFNGCTSLKQINIPSTITYIGTFKDCTALEKVIVNDLKAWCEARHYDATWYGPQKMAGTLYVGTEERNTEITELVIPDGTTSVEAGAFCYLPKITSVTIPASVKYLGGNTFQGCTGLTEVILPEGLEQFGYHDFAGCTSLATLTIPSTVTKIDTEAFEELPAIENVWCYAFPNELNWRDYDRSSYFKADKATLFHVVNADAWQEKFPEANVTYVGDIEVGTSTITYNADAKLDAFDDYTKFKGAYGFVSHDFADGQGTARYVGDVDGVGANAFRDIEGLSSILIPEGTTSIGNSAFQGCTSLTTMTIPASVTEIGDYAFYGCTNLATLTIKDPEENTNSQQSFATLDIEGSTTNTETVSEGLQSIGRSSFEGCSKITSLSLPSTLTFIDYEAFCGMTQLADVYCKADAADVTWQGSDNSGMFMADKATQFHVYDATAWQTQYGDANVTYVGDLVTGIADVNESQKSNVRSQNSYNLSGQRVSNSYSGIIIVDGKKIVNR